MTRLFKVGGDGQKLQEAGKANQIDLRLPAPFENRLTERLCRWACFWREITHASMPGLGGGGGGPPGSGP